MSITYAVFNSISLLPAIWNSLLTQSHALHTSEIANIENASIENTTSYYVITYINKQPILLSYFQLLHVTPAHFNIADNSWQCKSLNIALNIVKPTLLVAGNLYRHDTIFMYFIDSKMPATKKYQLYEHTISYLIQYTKCSGVFIKDVPEDLSKEIEKDKSYTKMDNDISMYMPIPESWTTFSDYEKALKHKYVQRCKKIRKTFEHITIQELTLEEIITHQKDIENLYLQVTNKQMVSMGILNRNFFICLKKIKKEGYKLYGFFEGNTLIAFSSAIVHKELFDMNYIGIDYQKNHQYNLYFNILFHCLEQAIASRSTKLVLGRTAPEAKAILGCIPQQTHGFYKLRNPIVNWFFHRVSKRFSYSQGEAWKDRHPFKSSFYV